MEAAPERVEAFAALLRGMVEEGLASLVAVLRSDTYGRFQAVEPFLAMLGAHGATLDLLPPSHSRARRHRDAAGGGLPSAARL